MLGKIALLMDCDEMECENQRDWEMEDATCHIISISYEKKGRKLFLSDLWSSVQGIACSRTESGLQSSEESLQHWQQHCVIQERALKQDYYSFYQAQLSIMVNKTLHK